MIDPIRGFVYQTGDLPRGGSKSGIDLSAGFLGFSEQFYFGFAAHHLTEPNESLLTNRTSPLPRKYTGHVGFHIPWSGNGSIYRETETIVSPNILAEASGRLSVRCRFPPFVDYISLLSQMPKNGRSEFEGKEFQYNTALFHEHYI